MTQAPVFILNLCTHINSKNIWLNHISFFSFPIHEFVNIQLAYLVTSFIPSCPKWVFFFCCSYLRNDFYFFSSSFCFRIPNRPNAWFTHLCEFACYIYSQIMLFWNWKKSFWKNSQGKMSFLQFIPIGKMSAQSTSPNLYRSIVIIKISSNKKSEYHVMDSQNHMHRVVCHSYWPASNNVPIIFTIYYMRKCKLYALIVH